MTKTASAPRDPLARMRGARVYLDTNAFIYLLESTPKLGAQVASLLDASERHELFACTGDAAIAELLVKPMRDRNTAAIGVIDALFAQTAMIEVLGHTGNVFRLAASLRAERKLRFIDALHLATALSYRCAFFVTSDADLKMIDGIEVVNLSALD
jgi:predicted nucleic acid-binding protein